MNMTYGCLKLLPACAYAYLLTIDEAMILIINEALLCTSATTPVLPRQAHPPARVNPQKVTP
jgi:hypothetical protein